jgi:hypothetical protein
MVHHGRTLLALEQEQSATSCRPSTQPGGTSSSSSSSSTASDVHVQQKEAQGQLDQACLQFSIAILDHTITGDLFDSVLVGFLAVLGVNVEKQAFYDACSYTSNLSALVKIAQLLVIQQAVSAAESGDVSSPAAALDEMRERFMVYNTRSPFAWITRLRAFGKKVRNTITSLGQIYWSDDQQSLSYQPGTYGPSSNRNIHSFFMA